MDEQAQREGRDMLEGRRGILGNPFGGALRGVYHIYIVYLPRVYLQYIYFTSGWIRGKSIAAEFIGCFKGDRALVWSRGCDVKRPDG